MSKARMTNEWQKKYTIGSQKGKDQEENRRQDGKIQLLKKYDREEQEEEI